MNGPVFERLLVEYSLLVEVRPLNNRLDYIAAFEDADLAILEMNGCRSLFIELDEKLRQEVEKAVTGSDHARARVLSNARTRLEEACHHAIKALALKHEKKS